MRGAVALRKPVQAIRYDLSGGAIGNAAWVQILTAANNKVACSGIEIFNPTGSTILLALGAPGSEVAIPYSILPGGTTGFLSMEIASGKAISMKTVDAAGTGAVGIILLNQFG